MNGAVPVTGFGSGCPVGTMVGGGAMSTTGAVALVRGAASGALVAEAMDENTDAMSKASSSFRLCTRSLCV
jgi:hypothetical protein